MTASDADKTSSISSVNSRALLRPGILFFFGLLFFFTYHNLNHQFIIIEEFTGDFYIIPKNKGGEKVSNIDKKSLKTFCL